LERTPLFIRQTGGSGFAARQRCSNVGGNNARKADVNAEQFRDDSPDVNRERTLDQISSSVRRTLTLWSTTRFAIVRIRLRTTPHCRSTRRRRRRCAHREMTLLDL
jgi:hypothetical protein